MTVHEWEWDFYQVIPSSLETERIPNHRLFLRPNRKTGRYEVRRHFFTRRMIRLNGVVAETGEDLQAEEVAFEGDFAGAVKFANNEVARYGSKEFEVCEHRPPKISRFCPDAAGMFPDQLQGVTWRLRRFRTRPWHGLVRRLQALRF